MSGLSHTPGKRARGYTLRGFESRLLRQKKPPHCASSAGFCFGRPSGSKSAWATPYFCTCTIFIAEAISADTSVMLLGTIKVVVASAATLE